jgi:membrane-bound lytic murein transglycosylase A
MKYILWLCVLVLGACAGQDPIAETADKPLALSPANFSALPGWANDDFAGLDAAFTKSCQRIVKSSQDSRPLGPLPEAGTYADWKPACQAFIALTPKTPSTLRSFFEMNFKPYAVHAGNKAEGLFTGYYEASLRGSLTKQGPYQIPLHARPDDLVMVQLGDFREELKGQRIAGRVRDGNLKPYESRAEIVNGKWPHNDKVLLWVDDPVDAFFVQIQGSGLVELPDGSLMRIGYAGQNGHPYYAIGAELVKRGALAKENVSMQSIRAWLTSNPAQAAEIMNTNKSYVFFHKLDGQGPIGGEGTSLTPLRSLAIDRSLLPYGAPFWLSAEHPETSQPRIERLMIAQDTGGAIRGPVRGDVFWGHGASAEAMAGPMKSKGQYWILLPKSL